MEEKYNPVFLFKRATQHFEAMEGNMTVTNDELANYRIEIEIKDSAKKYTIDMDKKGRILVLEGARASLLGWVKNPDELEKNKDNLGAVVVNRKKKEPVEYPDFENFYKTIKK